MDIFLCGRWADGERDAWLHALRAALPEARWLVDTGRAPAAEAAARIEVAVVANPTPGRLQGLPRLRLIQSLWAGVDGLLADPSLPADVPLARMVDPAMNAAMAETALWATLMLQRGFHRYAVQQRAQRWAELPQRRAQDVTVTLLGLGQMGQAVAARLLAQGYRVQGWRSAAPRSPGEVPADLQVHHGAAALPALLACTDIVINLLPLTPATRGLLDARFFAALKPGAAVVNLARGGHLVEADLLVALAAGQVSHAVLDVFQTEPLPPGHPFWDHPQVTVLPHAAAQTDPLSAAQGVARNVLALAAGQPLSGSVQRQRGY